MLSQPNLIKAKGRTLSSLNPHGICLRRWEIQGRANIWWWVLINGRPG